MIIPAVCPFSDVLIERIEEKIMNEPDMAWKIGVESGLIFKLFEECLPLGTNAGREVCPKSFNPDVMNTPNVLSQFEPIKNTCIITYLPQI